ncbi:uncharacterized protein LOC123680405 isoform X2 [Harmonia axyridis]|uniref:uncharacterized protein LOC123680405 isoform X2 n=1 Tax=Harmonia axyridis TaxID=115357 RepID=UPI001E2792F3|nr:uncharacterized protein LOC123680405 isoform X2 [Harmonia axyridis]
MRSKDKPPTRSEILRNFTREFLIEEKRRCEIDRYVTDFRILIHSRPHENHNYLNRLLQDYTNMFLAHERISANRLNQDEMKYQLKSQLASRKKDSPKQRYVQSKLSHKNDKNHEHQSYLVLKAKTEEFLKKIRQYDELEQIAYEIFVKNSELKTYEPNTVLKLKSSDDIPLDIPYKKHYRNVYTVNSPKDNKNNENYEFIKEQTEKFLSNNRDYNDAEQKILSEQYQKNPIIKKYVDSLTRSAKSKNDPQNPKRGIYSKIKTMIGFSPEKSTKFYKTLESNLGNLTDNTKIFLRNERKYNNSEFEAYKLFYIKNGEFQNPLIEKIKQIAYETQKDSTDNPKKIKIKHLVGMKNARNQDRGNSEKEEFEDYNLVKCSPPANNEPESKMKDIHFQFQSPKQSSGTAENTNKIQPDVDFKYRLKNINEFLEKQKLFEDQQRYYYVIHMRKHHINPVKERKEGLFAKIKHLFFGKNEKSKEKTKYFKDITQEFLKNEQYFYDLETQGHIIFSGNKSNRNASILTDSRSLESSKIIAKRISPDSSKKSPEKKSVENKVFEETASLAEKNKTSKKREKSRTSPPSLHQRSRSEDLLMFKTRTKSLDGNKSPTGHKTFSDRLKSMVGIGNRRRTKSRDNILRSSDPVQNFINHERFYYDGVPKIDQKYARSISSIEHMPKDGTIKTKTKKFLSTENVLYQDNSNVVGKPPTGRRRRDERNRDSKERRRSRTLSPAQKLVSKIRNLVHKNDKQKEDPNLEGNEMSSSDNKGPNNQLEATSVKTDDSLQEKHIKKDNSNNQKNASVNKSIVAEKKVDINNLNPEFMKNQTRIFLQDIKKYHDLDKGPDTVDKTLIFINNKSKSTPVFVSTEVKSMDGKENVGSSKLKLVESNNITHHKYSTTETRQKVVRNTIIKESVITQRTTTEKIQKECIEEFPTQDTKSNTNIETKKISIEFSPNEEHFYENMFVTKDGLSESNPMQSSKEEEYSAQTGRNINNYSKSHSTYSETKGIDESENTIIEKDEKIHLPRTIEEKVQNSKETNITYEQGHLRKMISIKTETQREPTNKSLDEFSSVMDPNGKLIKIKNDEYLERQQRLDDEMKKLSRERKNMNTAMSEVAVEVAPKNIENSSVKHEEPKKKAQDPVEIIKKEQILIAAEKQSSANKRLAKFPEKEEKPKKELKKTQIPQKVIKEEVIIEAAEKQSSAPKRLEKSPEKEEKPKKSAFSKLKTFVSGTSKKPTAEESNKPLRQQTSEFLDDMRKNHDHDKDAMAKYKIVWLEEKKVTATKVPKQQSEPVKLVANSEKEKQRLKLIRQNTDNFLKDHQDYHNRQRIDDNQFFTKIGQPEHLIWLSSRPAKKKDNIITKVKNLMSPQQSKKTIPTVVDPNDKIMRDQTDEFLKKHQYLIHKEELEFKKTQIPQNVIKEEIIIEAAEKQSSAPKRLEKSPEKEEQPKKSAFLKLKTFVSGTSKKPTAEESNKLLRQQTSEFLDDMRKNHDHDKDAMAKYKIVWLEEKKVTATKVPKQQSEPVKLVAINEKEKQRLKLIRQSTDNFLKDHQDYHNRQRIDDNQFFTKVGQPEHLIWLSSRPAKKKDNIITKVKNLMSPQQSKKTIPTVVDPNDKIMRDQTDEFLKKHQYLIHKEELEFKKTQIPPNVIKEEIIIEAAEKQSSAPKRLEKSPEKEEKPKKSAFSKLKTFVSGTSKKPTAEESNKPLRQQTSEFLDDMRKNHDHDKDAMAKYKIVWLEEKKVTATKVPKQQSEPVKLVANSEKEKQRLKLIRQNTDNFLKDHQDYHNRQRIDDNQFFTKVGQPEHLIWLSSRPAKKKDNIITKVKNLMSPQQSKKTIPTVVDPNDKIMRDQTDEFLMKHQYLIHKEELEFKKTQIPQKVIKEEIIIEAAEKKSSAPKRLEKSPEKEEKPKKSTFSKLKTFVSGTSKKPTAEESNKLLRKQTSEFLDDMRKNHDHDKDAMAKYKIVWLEEKKVTATKVPKQQSEPVKLVAINEKEKQRLKLIRQSTDNFLKDHQDYHNRQRIDDNQFFTKVGQPEHLIWLSSRPAKKKDNIITKVKNLMSPQQSKKTIPTVVDPNDKIMRDQTDEFLMKHQYLIHKEELEFKKTQIPVKVIKEEIIIEAAEKQSSAPKRLEKSPEKEEKPKKSAFSKLKTFVSGTSKKPTAEESNKPLRQQTSEFLDDMRKNHDHDKDAMAKYKIVWLEEKKVTATKVPKQQSEPVKLVANSEKEKQRLKLIRQNTDNFLKDHQDYHNRQRIDDNQFFTKVGQPEHLIWLSSRPAKKKDNIITKVKNLMSPQQSKKTIPTVVDPNDKIMRDQTDEFLMKHQYLIHKEELEFKKTQIPVKVIKEEIIIEAAEKQSSAPKRLEKSPEKEEKPKKSAFSKLKTFVSGTSKKPTAEESNKLLRQQTSEFLDDMRKNHDYDKDAMAKYKIVWLEEKKVTATKVPKQQSEPVKLVAISEKEKQRLKLIRQNTDNFLKDHQDYHNRQRIDDNQFFTKVGQPEHLIWLSSRPAKKKDNIITKVKNLMSPQQSKKTIPTVVDPNDKIMRDQTDEFLMKHQYLIHKEELEFKKTQIPVKVIKEEIIIEAAEKQSSAPKRLEKSPEKEEKPKKSAFSKLKTFVSGTSKKPTAEESNKLLRQQTSEFLDDMRKNHDYDKDAMAKYKIVWLEEKKVTATKVPKQQSEPVKLVAISEKEKQRLKLIRQNTDNFLKDHQDYHNRQRIDDNQFFTKVGQPEHLIWLSSRPAKKKDNIITKVKNLMSPQQSKKTIPTVVDPNDKIMRDQTDEFLMKHQYLIHKEELEFKKTQIPVKVIKEEIIIEAAEKQSSAPKRLEKSPEKEEKPKKSAFSKLKTFVSGTSKKPTAEESNKLLRQQTSEFLDDMRKNHDYDKDAMAKYKIVWLEEKKVTATKVPKQQSEPVKLVAISEKEKQRLKLIRQNTDNFLKDHQDYHNRQRIDDNQFFTKVGQPEHLIWLSSRPAKKKDNIITKVKNLMSPQQSKKTIPTVVDPNDKIMRDQTDEFLMKHQYLIHKEELEFKKTQIPVKVIKEEIIIEAAEKQSSSPKRLEKSPEKEEKPKKSAFSKLKTFVSGTSKKPTAEESNKLLRQQTSEFLDDMRKNHDYDKDAMAKYKIVWLEEKKVTATKVPKQQSEPVKLVAISEKEKQRLKLIRQNTDNFLKDHQDYHNRQRIDDNQFFTKIGQPEHLIWLSSRPAKKKDNIITKVKNLMSPQQSKKTIPTVVDPNDKIMRDQTDEFLKKHQYLIHKEELEFKKTQIPQRVIKEEIIIEAAEKQSSAPKRLEKSPEKEEKPKKSAFSKLKTFVSGTSKKPTAEESNKLLRQQTSEFLDDMRKNHDYDKDAMAKYKIVWLEEKKVTATKVPKQQSEPVKLVAISEKEKQRLKLIRQNTDNFLKDHQDYHNRQRIDDNKFFTKVGQPEHLIWLSSRPAKKKDNIITKVKNLMSPQQSKKTIPTVVDPNDKIMRDQTDEFLKKHQYLIHKEELEFKKTQIPVEVIKEEIIIEAAEKQSSAPKRLEKSPEKEEKPKKSTFSKLKTFVSGTSKKPTAEESNKPLRQQTSEFLDDMRKNHDHDKDAMAKYKIVWLEEKKVTATKVPKQQSEPVKLVAISEKEKQRLKLIRQNTDNFLKDHQDYHNRQRIDDNQFFTKIGQPEHLIWLSSRPAKKKDNLITKVKNLMSPQQSKKTIPTVVDPNDKIMRDQTDEFLKKHQYLIHKEELEFKKTQIPQNVIKEEIIIEAAEKQSSAPKRLEKSPEKEEKPKKSAFSKLKTFVSGTSKKPTAEESNKLLRKQTSEFLDDMRKNHDHDKDAMEKYKIVWLEEKKVTATKVPKQQSEPVKLVAISEKEKQRLKLIRQNTDNFLKDHQDYHNRQRIDDNQFFTKVGQPEHLIWLSSRPAKKKDNIITKVKNLMSPQQSKKPIPTVVDPNDKIMRDQTDEFLKKHQYLIHKEELEFKKTQIPQKVIKEEIIIEAAEKQSSAPKRLEKSPEKEEKPKKSTFSKLKTFVSGTSKKPTAEESNKLLRKQTSEFLDDMRKNHDLDKDAMEKYKIVWLEEKKVTATKVPKQQSEPVKLVAISEKEKQRLKLIRQNTDNFLKDHQDYHNRQRIDDNQFFTKIGQPEHLIWLSSRPAKKKDNIITKVKNLMSPQQSKKTIPTVVDPNDKIMRDHTDEFLKKHQYLIHKEELEFKKTQIPQKVIKEEIIIEAAEKQSSAPKRLEKSPEKEEKPKKSAFSKLKTFVSGTSKKPTAEESNKLLRQQTSEFLDDMRKNHDYDKDAMAKYKIVWLEEKKVTATKVPKQQSEPVKLVAISEKEKQRLKLIRQSTDTFLKDHQDYHNRQRIDDNQFFTKVGQPEHLIWLSSRPAKKKDNIITKVKNLMSPQQSKKTIPTVVDPNDKIMRDQTDEFLKKHQYLIHKEELEFKKTQIPQKVIKEEIIIEAAEKQSSAPKRLEKSPEKEEKPKMSAFSKLKTFVSGTSKKPTAEESNKLLRKQTSEFLDDMRKNHDYDKDAMAKYKIVWLEEKKVTATKVPKQQSEPVKLVAISEKEKQRLKLIRQSTDTFLKDHQDYHNRQRIDDNQFFTKVGQPEHLIWLSSRPAKKKDNIITKVKNLMSPQQSKKTIPTVVDPNDKIMRDQTDEFLMKHQYLIHKEELEFKKTQIPVRVIKEEIIIEAAEKQSSAPKRLEKSPEKEEKPKKSAFSKLKTFVSGTSKKPTAEESNKLLRQQTSEFLDDMRKNHDHDKDAMAKYKIVWLEEKKVTATKVPKQQSEPVKLVAISEKEKQRLKLIRQNTDNFLKDHQDYHNRQRKEDNKFFTKVGQPEHLIWLSSRPAKKKDNIITIVKNLMSPQQSKKTIPTVVDPNDKIMRDQTDEFLKKHQYLIHKEELEFKKTQIPQKVIKEEIIIEAAEKQSSAPKRLEKSPEKEEKPKMSAFSKLKTFVSGTSKKPTAEESNKLLRKQTSEFLDDMRKNHDYDKDAMAKYKIVWLEEKKVTATKVPKQQSEPVKLVAISEKEKQRLKLIRQNTDNFLKDHQDYHNRQRKEDNKFFTKVGQPEHLIWLSSRPAKKKDNIITKVKNLMSPQQSKKTIPTIVDPNDKIMRDQTDEFLRKHQYLIHREEFDCQKVPVRYSAEKQYSESKRMKKSLENDVKPTNYSHESSIPDEIKKIPSSKKDPTVVVSELTAGKISEVQTETLTKQPNVKPRKNLREKVKDILTASNPTPTAVFYYDTNSEMDTNSKNSEQEKRDISGEEIHVTNSPLSDDHTSSDVPSDNSSLSVRQKKKVTFSQSPQKETTNDSEGNVEEKNGDMSSDFTNITSSQRSSKPSAIPRKQIRKKVNAVFIDSAEIFKQDKERYLIQETSEFLENHRNHQNSQWIDQYSVVNLKSEVNQPNKVQLGDSKPKPSPRSYEQVTTSSPTLPQKTSPSEIPDNTYFETRRNLLLFLDDHRAYHDRERNYFISFISKQNKPNEDDRKTTSKEPKLKAKLMSKIKSLVGQENISLDKKRDIENALLRKQTLEFLISQKCYNDLEGDASYKFYVEYPVKRGSGSLGSGTQKDNSNFQEDSTFCSPRKLPVNGSPESQIKKSQKPLKSSLDEKVSKTDKIKTQEVPYSKSNQQNESTNYLLFMDQSKNFLDSQRNYINTENKIWCQYLKYKPEAGWSRITPSESIEKSNESRYISTTLNAPVRKSSSQIESEKIDHEVILHKTNLFLIDHKRFHDNLQMESSKFASKQPKKPAVESKIKKKGEGVLTKVKSLLPSGHTKNRSYDIQKADGINQNTEGQKNIYVERKENLEVISSSKQPETDIKKLMISSKQPETDIKELTKNFLIDHQEYHNQEKLHSKTRLSKGEEKEKKSKKGVMSKIKSLVIGDSHKKIPSKKPINSISTENVDEPDTKITDEKKRISIREYTSSPETYRRSRPKNSQVASSKADQETKPKQEILDNKKPTIVKNEEFRISSISWSERQLHPLEKNYASTEGDESTNLEIFEKVESSIHSNQLEVLPGDEKRRYAAAKIKTQEFLLNEKQNLDIIDKVKIKESEDFKNNISPISFTSNSDSVENIPSMEKNKICKAVSEQNTNTKINSRTRVAPLPSAPSLEECEDLSDREKENVNSVIHRVVTPLSPTKTIFKEIRKREDSPDRKVYIVKEGYMITKENKDDMTLSKDARTRIEDRANQFSSIERQPYLKDGISGEKNISLPRNFVAHFDGSASPITKARNGQDYVDRSYDSPSQAVPQGDLEVRRHHTKKRTMAEAEQGPATIKTETRIQRGSNGQKKYTTSCYLNKISTPVWYTESLLLDLEEKTKKTNVKVYYDDLYQPYRWEESFNTDLTTEKKTYITEVTIPVNVDSEEIHYISLDDQQQRDNQEK